MPWRVTYDQTQQAVIVANAGEIGLRGLVEVRQQLLTTVVDTGAYRFLFDNTKGELNATVEELLGFPGAFEQWPSRNQARVAIVLTAPQRRKLAEYWWHRYQISTFNI